MLKYFFIIFLISLHKGINASDDIENVSDENIVADELNNDSINCAENCTDLNDITNTTESVFNQTISYENNYNSTIQDKCSQCELPQRYFDNYRQKGCVAVYSKECPNCYERFDCPKEDLQSNLLSCKYAGKSYEIGATIDDNNPCTECYCAKGFTSANINCAFIECPEIFSYAIESDCYLAYVPNSCCLTEFCNYNRPNNTCIYENVEYLFGSLFFPSIDPCLTCTCTENFDKNNPLAECNKMTCILEDFNKRRCLPVYANNTCCPIEYICPNKTYKSHITCIQPKDEGTLVKDGSASCNDHIERYYFNGSHCEKFIFNGCGGNKNNFNSISECMDYCIDEPVFLEKKCYFDGKIYEIGEFFIKDDNITCTCQVPPLLQCIHS